jgi:lipid-A-disaccharide synthase-like uncharacterized protein
MLYKQEGWKVSVSRLAGYLGAIVISLCLLLYMIGSFLTINDENGLTTILSATFFYLIIVGGIVVFLIYHVWKYPDIRVVDNGIKLTILSYTMHIDWKNIKDIRRSKNELFIFLGTKGLLFNRLYGLLNAKTWDQPVVIFISNENKVKSLEKDLNVHIKENQ